MVLSELSSPASRQIDEGPMREEGGGGGRGREGEGGGKGRERGRGNRGKGKGDRPLDYSHLLATSASTLKVAPYVA